MLCSNTFHVCNYYYSMFHLGWHIDVSVVSLFHQVYMLLNDVDF